MEERYSQNFHECKQTHEISLGEGWSGFCACARLFPCWSMKCLKLSQLRGLGSLQPSEFQPGSQGSLQFALLSPPLSNSGAKKNRHIPSNFQRLSKYRKSRKTTSKPTASLVWGEEKGCSCDILSFRLCKHPYRSCPQASRCVVASGNRCPGLSDTGTVVDTSQPWKTWPITGSRWPCLLPSHPTLLYVSFMLGRTLAFTICTMDVLVF